MIPKLYESFSTETTAGAQNYLGSLNSCHKCFVTEVRNGEYTFDLETSINDPVIQHLRPQRIIEAKPNPFDPNQCFEIQSVKKTTDGKIKANGKHIRSFAYQLVSSGEGDYVDVLNKYYLTADGVWQKLFDEGYITETCPFDFVSDKFLYKDFYLGFNEPATLGDIIGGGEGSIINTYGGELHFDNYHIRHSSFRGKGIYYPLRYGKNISTGEQSESCVNTYSHIYPYGQVRTSTGKYYYMYGDPYEIPQHHCATKKIMMLDCSEVTRDIAVGPSGGTAEAKAAMTSYAATYAAAHDVGKIGLSINIDVRAELDNMQELGLCDFVNVFFDRDATESVSAQIVSATYNVLLERWESLIIGQVPVTLADLVLKNRR